MLSSRREASEQVVDGDGHLVERDAGPHIVKEIIIYDVYDNDDNVGADNLVDPTTAIEIEHPKTNVVGEGNDSDNCLEEFNVAEHVAALNPNVEIVNNVVDAAEGGAKVNEENVESNNSANNLESSVGSAKNGAPLTEEINNVVDLIVDKNSELNESVAEVAVEGMETEVSEVLPPPSTPIKDIQSGYEGRTLSKKRGHSGACFQTRIAT